MDLSSSVATELDKLALATSISSQPNVFVQNLSLNYDQDNLSNITTLIKYYKTTGQNTDGTMTQKAITDAIAAAGGSSSGGGTTNLGVENAGKLVKVGNDGNITYIDVADVDLYNMLLATGLYQPQNIIGICIDYENKTVTRSVIDSINDSQYDGYAMFGARKLCIVNDNGEIIDTDPATMQYDGS